VEERSALDDCSQIPPPFCGRGGATGRWTGDCVKKKCGRGGEERGRAGICRFFAFSANGVRYLCV